jgi:AraC-like DNA-binding protein
MHRSHIDAQRRYPVHIVQQGQINLVGVRFRPCGLAAFLPLPMSALQGLTLDLYSIFGPRGDELEHRLFDVAYNRHQQLSLLNEFFMRRLNVPPTHALVSDLATMIDRRYGQVTIRELGYTCGYSVRTVDRLFQEVMGLSPKFYARAMRLRHTLHGLVQYPATPWADLVGNYGYYDQPHFIKEFAALTGLRPEEYRTRVEHYRASPPPNHVHFLQDDLATEPIR